MRGGARTGSGRPKGSPNKASTARAAEIAASGLTPLDYFLSILRNSEKGEDVRLDAAKAAAPYVHPRLSSVEAHIEASFTIGSALDAIDG